MVFSLIVPEQLLKYEECIYELLGSASPSSIKKIEEKIKLIRIK